MKLVLFFIFLFSVNFNINSQELVGDSLLKKYKGRVERPKACPLESNKLAVRERGSRETREKEFEELVKIIKQ